MIQTKELIYEYEKRDEEGNIIGMKRAIDGVDIDIPEGSFVAILGHNGSGKSTLAKHMNAILVPSGEMDALRRSSPVPSSPVTGAVAVSPTRSSAPSRMTWSPTSAATAPLGSSAATSVGCQPSALSLRSGTPSLSIW